MPRGPRSDRWGRVAVRCFGRYWQLRDVPASTWIEAVGTPDMAGVWPGLVDDADAEDLYNLWLSENDMRRRCLLVSRKALERAGRREYHWTQNLIKELEGSWTQVNGMLVRQGVRADSTSLPDYLDAVYTLFTEKLDAEGAKAFEARLRKLTGTISKPRMSGRAELLGFAKD